MSWSLGEIRALSVKAARGAGMDWGIAEEAGFAVEWLEANGLDGVKALAQYLSKVHRQDNFSNEHCPLMLGCLVSDTSDWSHLQDKKMHEPMLLIPFVANIVGDKTLVLNWANNSVLINQNGVTTQRIDALISQLSVSHYSINIELSESNQKVLDHKSRVLDDAKAHVAILNALAHKTYAPATEASRLAGAGAGLNDND